MARVGSYAAVWWCGCEIGMLQWPDGGALRDANVQLTRVGRGRVPRTPAWSSAVPPRHSSKPCHAMPGGSYLELLHALQGAGGWWRGGWLTLAV